MAFMIPNPMLNPQQYPDVLYRVHFPEFSSTSYDDANGFVCTAPGRINLCDYGQLAYELENHLVWNSGEPSHFVSMFGDKKHALAWAKKKFIRDKARVVEIMEINPFEIKNAYNKFIPILQLRDVMERYPDLLPRAADLEWTNDEFLALYKVPAEAILKVHRRSRF
ncbi:hypothetical protein TWF481_008976 [Arthrobotrys musiformis]|uniref:DUF7587 domain-containing protein n=1 Tax=Arthrobotrys musiformis TaxID=47236 RepID=A0AAV9W3J7_9PEZI